MSSISQAEYIMQKVTLEGVVHPVGRQIEGRFDDLAALEW
jgi:hypothetical protein